MGHSPAGRSSSRSGRPGLRRALLCPTHPAKGLLAGTSNAFPHSMDFPTTSKNLRAFQMPVSISLPPLCDYLTSKLTQLGFKSHLTFNEPTGCPGGSHFQAHVSHLGHACLSEISSPSPQQRSGRPRSCLCRSLLCYLSVGRNFVFPGAHHETVTRVKKKKAPTSGALRGPN